MWFKLFASCIVGSNYSYIGAETREELRQEEDLLYQSPYMMKILDRGLKGLKFVWL